MFKLGLDSTGVPSDSCPCGSPPLFPPTALAPSRSHLIRSALFTDKRMSIVPTVQEEMETGKCHTAFRSHSRRSASPCGFVLLCPGAPRYKAIKEGATHTVDLGVPSPGPCGAFRSSVPFPPPPPRPTCAGRAYSPAPVAPPAAGRLGCSELHPVPEAFCALLLPIRPTLIHSCSVASACEAFPMYGAPLAYPFPRPFTYLVHHICGKTRCKIQVQNSYPARNLSQPCAPVAHAAAGLVSRPSIRENSVVREPLCGLAPTLNSGLMVARLLSLCVPRFLGLRKVL